MRRVGSFAVIGLMLLLAVGIAFVSSSGRPDGGLRQPDRIESRERSSAAPRTDETAASRRIAIARAEPELSSGSGADRSHRDPLRTRILAAERERNATAAPNGRRSEPGPEPQPGLDNHLDGHDEMVAELNRDFLPLADECIEAALDRDPALAGMLAVEFELVADADLGVIVETVEFPAESEVGDPELHACVSESLLSSVLPPGEANGREQLMLTLRVGD